MKAKNNWLLAGTIGLIVKFVVLISVIITITGAFHLDPSERANRMDYAWAALGLAIAFYSFQKAMRLNKSK